MRVYLLLLTKPQTLAVLSISTSKCILKDTLPPTALLSATAVLSSTLTPSRTSHRLSDIFFSSSTGQFFFDNDTLTAVAATDIYAANAIAWSDAVANDGAFSMSSCRHKSILTCIRLSRRYVVSLP